MFVYLWLSFLNDLCSINVEQTVACAPCKQRVRDRSPVRTSFLGEVFSGFFLTCKTNVRKLQAYKGHRISFGRYNHLFIFTLLEWMGAWMVCIVFNVHLVSEVAPALIWSFIRGRPTCPCVVKKYVCDPKLFPSPDRSWSAHKCTYKGKVKLR